MVESRPWARGRWAGLVFAVFCVQLGFILLLGSRAPIRPGPVPPSPSLQLRSAPPSEFLALSDPTLFALPNAQGFSGPAWLPPQAAQTNSFVWDEPVRWLPLPVELLGAAFREFMQTNELGGRQTVAKPEPDLTLPEAGPVPILPQRSTLRLAGDLAQRRLLTSFDLPSWPPRTNALKETDLLTNSVLQLLVAANGRPVSVTLLSSSGGWEADSNALRQAAAARFEAIPGSSSEAATNPLAHLSWGKMIFQWATVSPAAAFQEILPPPAP